MDKLVPQFIKFCIVGFFGALLNYSTFFALYSYLYVNYIIASGTGFVFSLFLAFYLNKNYTFKNKTNSKLLIIKYFLVNIFSLCLGLISLAIIVEILYLNVYLSNFIVIGIQTTSNFIGSKLFVFRN
jgi:putative flippase GtrA